MLKGIDNRLGADLLCVLRAMGHGDELVVCDANFPAESVSRGTVWGRPVSMDGFSAPDTIAAILSLLPLDSFVPSPVGRMTVVDSPDELPAVQSEVQAVVERAAGGPVTTQSIERFAFYERARSSYAIVRTGERRFYGCFTLKKGVIPPG